MSGRQKLTGTLKKSLNDRFPVELKWYRTFRKTRDATVRSFRSESRMVQIGSSAKRAPEFDFARYGVVVFVELS